MIKMTPPQGTTSRAATAQVVRIWDLPTRAFHWLLVVLLTFSFVTGKMGKLEWHMVSGKLILSLVLFRLAWGFVGGGYARFAEFLKGPGETFGYGLALLRGHYRRYLGHNPLGGWSVMVMLALVALQAGTGLFTSDDIYTDGPLAHLVSERLKSQLSTIHRTSINLLLAVVALHVLASLFYLFVKKDNLIVPMITGNKRVDTPPRMPATPSPAWPAPVLLAVSAAIVFGGLALYGK